MEVKMVGGFRQILLPIDFSVHCDRAAEYAGWFARTSGGTVHLVHVISNPADSLYEPEEMPHWVMVEHAEKKALELLEKAERTCIPAGYSRQLHVALGDPYERIIEVAERIRPDVIVMSTHGRGGVAHLVMGSVAEKVIRHAPCPVFVVRRS